MRKILFSMLVICAIVSNLDLNAQKKNLVKINFLSPILKTFNVQYERVLTEKSSFQLGFYYTGAKSGDVKLSGIGITPEYRFYLSSEKTAPAGFFVGPFLRYQNMTLTTDVTDDYGNVSEGKASLNTFRPGFLVGYQWLFSERVSFEMFMGPTYAIRNLKVTSSTGTEDDFDFSGSNGFGIRSGISLGIAF